MEADAQIREATKDVEYYTNLALQQAKYLLRHHGHQMRPDQRSRIESAGRALQVAIDAVGPPARQAMEVNRG